MPLLGLGGLLLGALGLAAGELGLGAGVLGLALRLGEAAGLRRGLGPQLLRAGTVLLGTALAHHRHHSADTTSTTTITMTQISQVGMVSSLRARPDGPGPFDSRPAVRTSNPPKG